MAVKILVVEPEERRRERLLAALPSTDHVYVCHGVQEAMTLLQGDGINPSLAPACDLILCAVYLDSFDKLTAFDLLKWAKKDEQLKNVPFVLLDIEPGEIAKRMVETVRIVGGSMGALAYMLMNTFDAAEFKESVDTYLNRGEGDA